VARGVSPGWYPDYEAPSGHQRYWNGERWTERRPAAPGPSRPASAAWLWTTGAALLVAGVATVALVALVVGDHGSEALPGPSSPGPSDTGSPTSVTTPDPSPSPSGRGEGVWLVSAALDGSTLKLSNGAQVRLVGIAESCGALELTELVVGQEVTLTRRGPDKDAEGRLLRYVDHGSLDIGKRLIQRGLATASEAANPRRAIYRRIDERSPDACRSGDH
jgi:Protein of unknown function (DUF2510)